MSSLEDVGGTPSRTTDICHKGYVDSLSAQNISQETVDSLISSGLSPYTTKAYVDSQDLLNANQAYVDAGDATRLHLSQVNANNGVAGLDSSGRVEVARVDVPSDQVWPVPFYSPSAYNGGTITATGTAEATVYTLTVPDQGHPFCFSMLAGLVDVDTTVDGEYPIVRVRAGSVNGPIIAVGQGSSESYHFGFSAVGPGDSGGDNVAQRVYSYSMTTTAGSYVIVDVATFQVPTGVTYDGVAMTLLASKNLRNDASLGILSRYGLAGVPGGTKTVVVTLGSSDMAVMNAVAYLGVSSVGATQTVAGNGNPSQAVTVGAGQMAVQSFAGSYSQQTLVESTGTNRWSGSQWWLEPYPYWYDMELVMNDAAASTTFAATPAMAYAGIATILNMSYPLASNYSTVSVVPTRPDLVLSGETDLYVTIASSGANATVSATPNNPSLWVAPIQAPPFSSYNDENTNRSSQPTPSGTAGCWVTLIGGGGAGGNGELRVGNNRSGGSGGGGGGRVNRVWIPAWMLGGTYSVTKGLGGATAQANGSASTFSSGSISLSAGGGHGGVTATGSAATGGIGGTCSVSGISATTINGAAGGNATTGVGAAGGNAATGAGAGGGAGGGVATTAGVTNGGPGGDSATVTGGAAGNSSSVNGSPPADASVGNGGAGGGGGAGRHSSTVPSTPVGNGAHGGLYGGGGGGGGTGSVAGTFGAGADGYTLVEWV